MPDKVLITGISGFIAKHIALKLLKKGYLVRGTLRSMDKAEETKQTLNKHGADISALEFVKTNLLSDDGWDNAVEGCKGIFHVASPFPMKQPKDKEALVKPALEGTLRVLRASQKAEAERIVITSSMVAMMYEPDRKGEFKVKENDWTDPEWSKLSAYAVSKTRAELAAWEWAKKNEWKTKLSVVNPGFVLGPTLDGKTNTSLNVIKLFLKGDYPVVPKVSYSIVDVRDLAVLHIKTFTIPECGGRRLIGGANTLAMVEMAHILRDQFPEFSDNIPTRRLPNILLKILSKFDSRLKSVVQDIGRVPIAETDYVEELTGISFRSSKEAVIAAAESIIDFNDLGD
ncbi:MAG: NAD-dependent epimerase/dehydratase family protein [Candidatus Lokiarchaeota archaeon]|nr:NAD-dependent epimerase/dehydratase family protein [Candidatus Lokiarchaeota archaeon]MBD3340173.1 NAD-dependent epimerase/dehydratase family protein [Candidatus Lokiarchaeota archaeon]